MSTSPERKSLAENIWDLPQDERDLLEALVQQVVVEKEAGGLRPRWSILRQFVHMTDKQVEGLIDLYDSGKSGSESGAKPVQAEKGVPASNHDDVSAPQGPPPGPPPPQRGPPPPPPPGQSIPPPGLSTANQAPPPPPTEAEISQKEADKLPPGLGGAKEESPASPESGSVPPSAGPPAGLSWAERARMAQTKATAPVQPTPAGRGYKATPASRPGMPAAPQGPAPAPPEAASAPKALGSWEPLQKASAEPVSQKAPAAQKAASVRQGMPPNDPAKPPSDMHGKDPGVPPGMPPPVKDPGAPPGMRGLPQKAAMPSKAPIPSKATAQSQSGNALPGSWGMQSKTPPSAGADPPDSKAISTASSGAPDAESPTEPSGNSAVPATPVSKPPSAPPSAPLSGNSTSTPGAKSLGPPSEVPLSKPPSEPPGSSQGSSVPESQKVPATPPPGTAPMNAPPTKNASASGSVEPDKAPEASAMPTKDKRVLPKGESLEAWCRRRFFELRVNLSISIGASALLGVLQQLTDQQLKAPYEEVKMWVGLDETQPLPAGVETLVTEFRQLRSGDDAEDPVPSPAAKRGAA